MTRIAGLLAIGLLWAVPAACAGEIDYLEDFALAGDRDQALKQLIPGSEDYYYYHCLHFQNTQQFDRVDKLLPQWIERYKETPRLREIQNRQALLTYASRPDASLVFLRQRLNLQFQHQRETLGEKPTLPTQLDASLIGRERLAREAFQRHTDLSGFEDAALSWLAEKELNQVQRRQLLERLTRPDGLRMVDLIVADLNAPAAKPFGTAPIHGQLLLDQLDDLKRRKPDLLNHVAFVNAYLSKLQPDDDGDWANDATQREAYLSRLWDFVRALAPVHNSLKAHVLYHRLFHDRALGVYDKDRFMTYIQLPRRVSYISPRLMEREESRRFPADLSSDYTAVTMLPPVRDDESLVRSFLHHFFVAETSTGPYEAYIRDDYLREHMAETKIVNGLGEPEQWYSWLPPAKYQALKERIDLDFTFINKQHFAADEPVRLDLWVKNVRTLIVKVFEINTRTFYRGQGREVNTDVNLDGLVANQEQTFRYDDPPLRRVVRHFDFSTLNRPGVYVVDFIGNGVSSRAVIRKGALRYLERTSTAGQILTVYDEANRLVREASAWLAGHEYAADAEGRIVIPFSTQPGRYPLVLSRGEFSCLAHLQHVAEEYRLAAGFYVDRESLLPRSTAKVVIRPALYLNGTPVTLSRLENVRLLITSTDLDGVSTTHEAKDFRLSEDRESVHEFQTPPRLATVRFDLQCKLQQVSRSQKLDLAASESFSLNAIDKTEKTEDLHLVRLGDVHVLELRGKTGEVKPSRPVHFAIKHRDFREPAQTTLQTDEAGRIRLGALADIVSVAATGPEGTSHTWALDRDGHSYPRSLHSVAGEAIELPFMESGRELSREDASLLELRDDTFVKDRFAAMTIADGMLRLRDLPPGDYDLLLKKSGDRVRIRVAAGERRDGYVFGARRHLELKGERPVQIASVEAQADAVRVQLRNATKFARVHVFATRFQPAFSAPTKLGAIVDSEPYFVPRNKTMSLYVAGRNIGDEYRYIIDRKYAQKFPGNMLERPSLLLSPWALRNTESGRQQAAEGQAFAPKSEAAPEAAERGRAEAKQQAALGDFANLDFLAAASAVLVNLMPDERGVVTIPRGELGPHQRLHIVAVDPQSTACRSFSLPETPAEFRDLRLASGLDPKQHFTQQKLITVVPPQTVFTLSDITTSRFELYDSLARVHTLYATLSGDAKLAEFSFVLNWPRLKDEEKRQLYSKYACHELNFFLYKKDAKFFANVVRPFLANKLHKTFLDHWLLGSPLTGYLAPWNHARLNVVERILLAQRVAEDREFSRRDITDQFALLPPDVNRFNLLFLTAVQGRSLESEPQLGKAVYKRQLSLAAEKDKGAFGAGGAGGMAGGALRFGYGAAAPPSPAAAAPVAAEEKLAESLGVRERAAGRRTLDAKGAAAGRPARGAATAPQEEAFFDREGELLSRARRLYEQLDKTQEWAENNYYQLPIESQLAGLVTVNAFWRDYAQHDPQQPFLSIHLAEASHNFTEMMYALAVLDLPFEAAKHASQFQGSQMTLTAGSSAVVFHEEIRRAERAAQATPILVSQNFFRHNDRYIQEEGVRRDKFVTDEFLVHTVYGCQVVVTNPTSAPQKLDVLVQIPRGSLPVLNAQATRSVTADLPPYQTVAVEYHFYFPGPGKFLHYPVHVAKNEHLLAFAEPVTLNVVEQPTRIDRTSWEYISQHGTNEDVLRFLQEGNLHRIKLEKIAFRMRDQAFFREVIGLLAKRHAFDFTLWSYSLQHNFVPAIQECLKHADEFVGQCGVYLDSPLLVIDPVARSTYQHLDYRPLVNARAHALGRRRQILNERLHAQYHQLLRVLSCKRQLNPNDLMSVTYYLLLQDRIEEAIGFFGRVDAAQLDTRLQYDCLAAYLALCREDVSLARTIAARYREYPVDRWRTIFTAVEQQIREAEGGAAAVLDPENRGQVQTELAASEPTFDFQVEARKVRLNYQNLKQARIHYYLMDIELLFSRNPFVQQYSNQFSHIRPNATASIDLPSNQNSTEIPLPADLHNRNVLVEITGGGQTKSQAYYSNSLALQVIENYGQVRVTSQDKGQPLAKIYVKVYARKKDGSVAFYKDGYTDLRGRFDYASLNTNELDFVDRFALLVLSDDRGAVVREAAPPKR